MTDRPDVPDPPPGSEFVQIGPAHKVREADEEPGAASAIAEKFHRELLRRGLQVLGVSRHRKLPLVLTVFLHGNAGQWVDGVALRLIRLVPCVLAAEASPVAPTIIVVHLRDAPDRAPRNPLSEDSTLYGYQPVIGSEPFQLPTGLG